MRTILLTAILLASSLARPMPAAPQSGNLVQQLQTTYIPNVMDPSGIKVAQAGSVLAVQVETVQANSRGKMSAPFCNDFENGQIKPCGSLFSVKNRIPGISKDAPRTFTVGEKMYLLKTEVQTNAIVFLVQSCGTCNPKSVDPAHQPYRAEVRFKFIKNALAATDFKSVQGVIEQVFKFPEAEADNTDAGAGGEGTQPAPGPPRGKMPRPAQAQPEQAPQQPAEAPQKFDPIAPPPPPPAAPAAPPAPKKIAMGQSVDEVKANFGEPEQIYDLGAKTIYKYKDFKVTFVKGKVADIE